MNDLELTSVDVRAVNESLFQNTATKTLPEEVNQKSYSFFVYMSIGYSGNIGYLRWRPNDTDKNQ